MLKADYLRFFAAPSIFAERDVIVMSLADPDQLGWQGSWDDLFFKTEALLDQALGAEAPKDGATGETPEGDRCLEDVVAQVVLRLQRAAGYDASWYCLLRGAGPIVTGDLLVVDCANSGSALLLIELALLAIDGAAGIETGKLAPEARQRVVDHIGRFPQTDGQLGGSEDYRLMLEAARRRTIPIVNPLPNQELLLLGQGAKRRKIHQHFPAGSDYTSVKFSVNKLASARLLQNAGLPSLDNQVVVDAEQAVRAAHRLGFPVVVKPNRGDFGEGISVFLQNDDEVRHAFKLASSRRDVLVEKHQRGDNHRLLVMYGRFVTAVRQSPAQVAGDGRRTVRELVAETNARRTADLTASFRKITVDAEAERILGKQGYGLDAVPPEGAKVLLRFHSNLSVGGTMENVTDSVHPDNQALALRAARVMGLEVAGLDFITTDITRSWLDGDCGIAEINATPGFIHGLDPGFLEDTFLLGMFPTGDDGRIPTVYVVEEGSGGALSQTIGKQLGVAGLKVAVARPQEVRLGATKLCGETRSFRLRSSVVFSDPEVEAAVIEVSLAELVREGLGQQRCTLAVFGPGSARSARPDSQSAAAARLLASIAARVVISAADGLLGQLAEERQPGEIQQVDDSGAGLAAWRAATSQALRAAASSDQRQSG